MKHDSTYGTRNMDTRAHRAHNMCGTRARRGRSTWGTTTEHAGLEAWRAWEHVGYVIWQRDIIILFAVKINELISIR